MTRSTPSALFGLAKATIEHQRPLGLVEGRIVALTLRPGAPDWTDVHGLRCGPAVAAAAFSFGWSDRCDRPLAFALDRHHTAIVADPQLTEPLFVDEEDSLLLDAARRVLGLHTPPPNRTPLELNDAVWLDRMLEMVLGHPLGEPPLWPVLASLHPLSDGCPTPETLRHHRNSLRTDWSEVHELASAIGVDWVPLTAAGAAWFDAGSLSRWLFAALPEPSTMLTELRELLRPSDFARVSTSLSLSGR